MEITRINIDAMRPTRSIRAPHGYDLYADISGAPNSHTVVIRGTSMTYLLVNPYEAATIPTGCKVSRKHSFLIAPPSDIRFPEKIAVTLSPKHTAENEVTVLVVNYSDKPFHIFANSQIARMILIDQDANVVIS